jgi:NADH-quinone oxidoreductase subunit E
VSDKIEQMTPELKAFIEEWKDKPGNLIMVLHQVQQKYGYIPRNIAIEISELLSVPLAKIYGVVTFYNFFKLQKAGKYIIQVCLGTACYLRGGDDLIKEFERQLGVGVNATTADGLFSIEAVRCLGCCGLAPVVVVNGEVYGKLGKGDVAGIIEKYRKLG